MIVPLKLNNDTIIAVDALLKKIYELPVSISKEENVYKSIGYELADKFDKKTKQHLRKASLFDQKKLTKFTLKFHEAWALHEILLELKIFSENDYKKMLIQTLINTLNQKLC